MHFSKRFVPYHSYIKLAKIRVLLENLAHIEKQSVFSIETLFDYPLAHIKFMQKMRTILSLNELLRAMHYCNGYIM